MQPSKQLRNSVRAAFINKGSDLAEFCRNNKICDSNANKALTGKWSGLKARELCLRLIEASGAEVGGLNDLTTNPNYQLDSLVGSFQDTER